MKKVLSFILAGILLVMSLTACSIDNRDEQQGGVTVETGVTFSEEGILFHQGELLRFVDAESGSKVALCDRPNCLHKTASLGDSTVTCNAAINGVFQQSSSAIYRDQLYFVAQTDESGIFNKELWRADVNGANRKQIAFLEDVQYIISAQYIDDYLLLVYENTVAFDETGFLVDLDQFVFGVVAVNLKTEKVTYLPTKQDYNSWLSIAHIHENKVYYEYTYYNQKYDDPFSEESSADFLQNAYTEIFCYDLESKTETSVLKEKLLTFRKFNGQYAYLSDRSGKSEVLLQLDLFTGETVALLGSPYADPPVYIANLFFDGNKMIYCEDPIDYSLDDQRMLYDLKTGESIPIGEPFNYSQPGTFSISALTSNKVYISYIDPEVNDFCYGYLTKEDFYAGNFDQKVPLLYPNQEDIA